MVDHKIQIKIIRYTREVFAPQNYVYFLYRMRSGDRLFSLYYVKLLKLTVILFCRVIVNSFSALNEITFTKWELAYWLSEWLILFCRVIVEHARGGPRGDDRRNSYRDYPPARRSRGGGGRDKWVWGMPLYFMWTTLKLILTVL